MELANFSKQVAEIETGLYDEGDPYDRTDSVPDFWNEEWLKRAIDELDTRKMIPEERAYFARMTEANAEFVNAEKQRSPGSRKYNCQNCGYYQSIETGKLTI